jgi:hypothetical protein
LNFWTHWIGDGSHTRTPGDTAKEASFLCLVEVVRGGCNHEGRRR